MTFEDAVYEKIHIINFLDFELILYIKTLSLGLLCLLRRLAAGSLSDIRSIGHQLLKYVTLDLCGLLIYQGLLGLVFCQYLLTFFTTNMC